LAVSLIGGSATLFEVRFMSVCGRNDRPTQVQISERRFQWFRRWRNSGELAQIGLIDSGETK
jgi:hypothetical protein